jgi:hypothetical protein
MTLTRTTSARVKRGESEDLETRWFAEDAWVGHTRVSCLQ